VLVLLALTSGLDLGAKPSTIWETVSRWTDKETIPVAPFLRVVDFRRLVDEELAFARQADASDTALQRPIEVLQPDQVHLLADRFVDRHHGALDLSPLPEAPPVAPKLTIFEYVKLLWVAFLWSMRHMPLRVARDWIARRHDRAAAKLEVVGYSVTGRRIKRMNAEPPIAVEFEETTPISFRETDGAVSAAWVDLTTTVCALGDGSVLLNDLTTNLRGRRIGAPQLLGFDGGPGTMIGRVREILDDRLRRARERFDAAQSELARLESERARAQSLGDGTVESPGRWRVLLRWVGRIGRSTLRVFRGGLGILTAFLAATLMTVAGAMIAGSLGLVVLVIAPLFLLYRLIRIAQRSIKEDDRGRDDGSGWIESGMIVAAQIRIERSRGDVERLQRRCEELECFDTALGSVFSVELGEEFTTIEPARRLSPQPPGLRTVEAHLRHGDFGGDIAATATRQLLRSDWRARLFEKITESVASDRCRRFGLEPDSREANPFDDPAGGTLGARSDLVSSAAATSGLLLDEALHVAVRDECQRRLREGLLDVVDSGERIGARDWLDAIVVDEFREVRPDGSVSKFRQIALEELAAGPYSAARLTVFAEVER
jgi:hypothetical protein